MVRYGEQQSGEARPGLAWDTVPVLYYAFVSHHKLKHCTASDAGAPSLSSHSRALEGSD